MNNNEQSQSEQEDENSESNNAASLIDLNEIKQITNAETLTKIIDNLNEDLDKKQTDKIALTQRMFILKNQLQATLEHCEQIENETAGLTHTCINLEEPLVKKYKQVDLCDAFNKIHAKRKEKELNREFTRWKNENWKSFRKDLGIIVQARNVEEIELNELLKKQEEKTKLLEEELKTVKIETIKSQDRNMKGLNLNELQEHVEEMKKLQNKFIHGSDMNKLFDKALRKSFQPQNEIKEENKKKTDSFEDDELDKLKSNLVLIQTIQAREIEDNDRLEYFKIRKHFEEIGKTPSVKLALVMKTMNSVDELKRNIVGVKEKLTMWERKLNDLPIKIVEETKDRKNMDKTVNDVIAEAEHALCETLQCVRSRNNYCFKNSKWAVKYRQSFKNKGVREIYKNCCQDRTEIKECIKMNEKGFEYRECFKNKEDVKEYFKNNTDNGKNQNEYRLFQESNEKCVRNIKEQETHVKDIEENRKSVNLNKNNESNTFPLSTTDKRFLKERKSLLSCLASKEKRVLQLKTYLDQLKKRYVEKVEEKSQ